VGPLPHRIYEQLASRHAKVEFVDLSLAFVALRMVKRSDEIELARRAAALADLAIEEMRTALRPGLRDFELGAIVEAAYRRRGGEHGICFLASASMQGGGPVVPSQVWSSRVLAEGDMVMIELSVGVDGVTSQVLRTVALGPPTPEVLRLHAVADEVFAALVRDARPGTPAARLLEVAGRIDEAGLRVVDDVVHGYGGGYLPPVLRTPATQRRAVPDLELARGMMLVLQPNVVTPDGRVGVQTGELVVVGEHAAGRLHELPTGLLRAP
jgi:Xaa-Pro aminopeptidase